MNKRLISLIIFIILFFGGFLDKGFHMLRKQEVIWERKMRYILTEKAIVFLLDKNQKSALLKHLL